MKYLFLYILIFSVLILSSCWWEEEVQTELERQEFFVETRLWSELQNETIIEKVWQVRSTQDIQVSSQASWRITNIRVRKWQQVQEWQVIAELQDTLWNIIFSTERAGIWLERAQIQKESTLLTLENQLFDIDIQLANLERSLVTLQSDREQNLKLLEDSVQSSSLSNDTSRSNLQIEQFDANLERQRLDFETRKLSDEQTRQSFQDFFVSNENTLRVLIDDIIAFADPIFSVSEKYRFSNTRFTTFLWARNSSQRSNTERLLRELIEFRSSWYFNEFRTSFVNRDLSDEEIIEWFQTLSETYDMLREFIPEMNETFINSLVSAGQLSETELSGWRTRTQWFQSSFSGNFSAYINTQNQANSFLKTYKQSQESQKRAIELQERERTILVSNLESWDLSTTVSKERAILAIDDQIEGIESQISQIKNTRETTLRNRDITQNNLENAIRDAGLWLRQSQFELWKLVIRSPISGVIEDVMMDVGQEIQMWSPVVSLLADSSPELQVSVSNYERNLLRVWQEVYVDIGTERYTWTITAISDVADRRFNYSVSVSFRAAERVLWSIARVSIPVSNDDFLIPIRLVEPIGESQWRITVLENGNIWTVRLRLWRVFWDNIEVLSCARDCETLEIIWNDVTNFNPNEFILRRR